MTDVDDAELFAAIARGERGALERLYDRHAPTLFAMALHAAGDRPRAEDLVHDAFLALARHARQPGARCERVLGWLVSRMFELMRARSAEA